MIKINKIAIIFLLLIFQTLISFGQIINISDRLTVTKISESVYIHTCDNSNGIVYVNKGEAIIVSTPPSDDITTELINWTKKQFALEIILF